MNPTSSNDLWERTVAAARRPAEPRRGPAGEIMVPPPGFAGRLANWWTDLKQNETFRLWCRWSFRAALLGALVAGSVAFLTRDRHSAGPTIRPPEVTVPSFPAS